MTGLDFELTFELLLNNGFLDALTLLILIDSKSVFFPYTLHDVPPK
jgi:hypothetical protein